MDRPDDSASSSGGDRPPSGPPLPGDAPAPSAGATGPPGAAPGNQGRYEFSFHVPLNPTGPGESQTHAGPGADQRPTLTVQFEFGFGTGTPPPGFGPVPPGGALEGARMGPRVEQGAGAFERVNGGRAAAGGDAGQADQAQAQAQAHAPGVAPDGAGASNAAANAASGHAQPQVAPQPFHLPLPFPTMQGGRPQLPTTDFPFPFFFLDALLPSAQPPDPARAKELLRGLKDPGGDMMRRVDRVTRAESGEEFRCAVCMEGWEDAVAPPAQSGGEGEAGPSGNAGADMQRSASGAGSTRDEREVEMLLKTATVKKTGGQDDVEPEGGRTSMKAFPCCHIFHEGCLEPWLQSKTTCPTCRFDIDPLSTTLRRPAGNRARFQSFRPGATQNANPAQRDRPYAARPAPAPNAEAGEAAANNVPERPQPVGSIAEAMLDYINRNRLHGGGPTDAHPPAPDGAVPAAPEEGDAASLLAAAHQLREGQQQMADALHQNGLHQQAAQHLSQTLPFGHGQWHTARSPASAAPNAGPSVPGAFASTSNGLAAAGPSSSSASASNGQQSPAPANPASQLPTAPGTTQPAAGAPQAGGPGQQANLAQFPLLGSFHFSLVPANPNDPLQRGPTFAQIAWPRQQAAADGGQTGSDNGPASESGDPTRPEAPPMAQEGQPLHPAIPPIPAHIDMTAVWATAMGTMRRLLPQHILDSLPGGAAPAAPEAAPAAAQDVPREPAAQRHQQAPPTRPGTQARPPEAATGQPRNASNPAQADRAVPPNPFGEPVRLPGMPPIHIIDLEQFMPGPAPALGNPIGEPAPMRRSRSTGPAGVGAAPLPRNFDMPPPPRRTWLPPAGKLTLDEWVTLREKALHWRCDDPVCLFAPPEHLSDLPVHEWNDWMPTDERCQPLISMQQKQPVANNGDAKAAGFNLLACGHTFHSSCVRTTARSSGWWSKDDEGRRLCRCPKCRKEGWIEEMDETPMEGIEAAA